MFTYLEVISQDTQVEPGLQLVSSPMSNNSRRDDQLHGKRLCETWLPALEYDRVLRLVVSRFNIHLSDVTIWLVYVTQLRSERECEGSYQSSADNGKNKRSANHSTQNSCISWLHWVIHSDAIGLEPVKFHRTAQPETMIARSIVTWITVQIEYK